MIDRDHMQTHMDDVERLQRLAFVHGYPVTLEQVYSAWKECSNTSAAGWLIPYDSDSSNWATLSGYLEDLNAANSEANDALDGFNEEIDRIVSILRQNGLTIDREEAYSAWAKASRLEGQAWQDLPGYDETIWESLKPIFETENA